MQKQTSLTIIPIPFAITTSSNQVTMQSQFGNHLLLSSLNVLQQNLVFPKQVSEKETRGFPAKRVKIVQRLCNKNLATSCWHHTSGCFCHAQLFVRDLVRCAAILRQQKPYIHLRSSYSKIDCLPQAALYICQVSNSSFFRPSDSLHVELKNHKYKLIAQSKPWRLSSQLGVLVGHEGCFDLPSFLRRSKLHGFWENKIRKALFENGSSINTWSLMNFNTT